MRARRALLYMPGNEMRKIRKAATLGVDCVCMDMEDGVAFNRKTEARQTIAHALATLDFGPAERLARINSIGSGIEEEDLAAVLPAHPDGIVIPKVEEAESIQWVSARIRAAESEHGWIEGGIIIIAIVETARGIVNLAQIAAADRRLRALVFGAEDLAGSIGATRTPESWEVFYARSAVVTHAAAFNLQAIDMVHIDFHDTTGLSAECQAGVKLGYTGKQVIHPNQVGPVQDAFTPSPESIRQAALLLDAYQKHQEAGRGVFAIDGKMIDAPLIKNAEQVIARARAAGVFNR